MAKLANSIKFTQILKSISHALSGNLIAAVLGFLTIAIFSSTLNPTDFGALVLVQSYVFVFIALGNPQSWQALIKFGSLYLNKDDDKLNTVITVCALQDLIYALISFVLAVVICPYFIKYFNLPIALVSYLSGFCVVILFSQIGLSIGILRLTSKFKLVAIHVVFAASLNFIVALSSFYFTFTLYQIMICLSVVMSISGGVLILLGGYHCYHLTPLNKKIIKSDVKEIFVFNVYTHFINIADIPIKFLDVILVGAILSIETAGIYKIIRQLGAIVDKFTGPIGQVLFPEFSLLLGKKMYVEAFFLSKKVTVYLMCVSIPFAIVVGGTSFYWLPLVFNDSVLSYSLELSVFFILQATAVSFMCIHSFFLSLGLVKYLLWITIGSNVFFMLGILFLGDLFGLMGVIMAIAIQYGFTIIVKKYLVSKKITRALK